MNSSQPSPPSQSIASHERRAAGFTLIELMVAVVVVAVLASLAYPSYMNSVRKSRRSEAVSALSSLQQAQERLRANNPLYASFLSADLVPGMAASSATMNTPNGYYTVGIEANTADAADYVILAQAVAGSSQDGDTNCKQMRLQLALGNIFYGGCTSCGTPTPAAPATDPNGCWAR